MTESLNELRNRTVGIGLVLFALMVMISAYGWFNTPAGSEVPVHWDSAGQVNRYGSRLEAFGLAPAIWLGVLALFAFLPALEPRRRHLAQSRRPYLVIMMGVGVTSLVIHCVAVAAALGASIAIERVIPPLVGALLMVTGNTMGKTRSNFFIGVKTPWTLSSELSWRKTHRWAGRMFVLLGAVMVVSVVLPAPQQVMLASVGALAIGSVALVVYSYVVWRGDPARS
ncbi:MAG: SdpI family protein [Pseudomonadota bacterium]